MTVPEVEEGAPGAYRVETGPGWTPEPNTGCFLWLRGTNAKGYGRTRRGLAHRLVWEEAHGPIPPGLVVMHRCDVPGCVNLDHLRLGTVADNVADMIAKGRARKVSGAAHPRRINPGAWPSGNRHWTRQEPERVLRGARNGRARLTPEQVAEARTRFVRGAGRGPGVQPNSLRALAREFGVDRKTLADAIAGKTWGRA